MKVRIGMISAILLVAAAAAPSYGRSIRVDFDSDVLCAGTPLASLQFPGSDFNPNVTPVLSKECGTTQVLTSTSVLESVNYDQLMLPIDSLNIYLWGPDGPGAAQVIAYSLSNLDGAALAGLTEIEFNYFNCIQGGGPADLTLGGATYTASCETTNTSSLLFNGESLVGWLDLDGEHTGLAGSGWSIVSAAVPEPSGLALFGLGLAVIGVARRGLRAR